MNCNEMLELMLEADPDELAGRGSSVVATHVLACTKCGAVAARLLTDTRALAAALDARSAIAHRVPARRARFLRPVAITGALAAATVLVVLSPVHHPAPPETTASIEPSAPASAPAPASAFATPILPHRFADAAPVVATQFVATPAPPSAPAATELATLSVDPPPGTRAAVLNTRNPAITVVWLY